MSETTRNKQAISDLIQTVWIDGDLAALPRFWTADCLNHAAPEPGNRGLDALLAYHQGFADQFAAFSEIRIEILKQISEDDQVVTYLKTQGRQTGPFAGIPPTGKAFTLYSMRIDRLEDGKIAEHWSVADVAGLFQQLQS